MLRKLPVVLLLQLCFISWSMGSGITELKPADVPDDIPFFDEDGKKVFLDEFEGQTVLLSFCATWSPSCIQEIPNLDTLQKDFRKLPFLVISVSEDSQGMKVIKDYFKVTEIRYLKPYHDYKNQLFKAFEVVGLPTSFLIDPAGKMVLLFVGIINWHDEEVRKKILLHIQGNPVEPKNSYNTETLNRKVKSKKDLPKEGKHE